MKKAMFVLGLLSCSWFIAGAQVNVSINIGTQPVWGPVGYDYVDYYYLPDADAYYDINGGTFMYMEGGGWRAGRSLPGRYSNIDLYHVHKVVINNDRNPWTHHDRYRNQYRSYAGRRGQQAIRDARERKYWQNPGHPQHSRWNGQRVSNGGRPADRGPRNYNNNRNNNRPVNANRNDDRGHINDNRVRGNDDRGGRNDNRGLGNDNRVRGNDDRGRGNDNHGHGNDNRGRHK